MDPFLSMQKEAHARCVGIYVDYIQEEHLKLSEFGEKIAKRLADEK